MNPLQQYVKGLPTKLMTLDELNARNQKMLKVVYPALQTVGDRHNAAVKRTFDKSHKIIREDGIKVGSLVYLKHPHDIQKKGLPIYTGPFRITKIHAGANLELFNLNTHATLDRIHIHRVRFISNPVKPQLLNANEVQQEDEPLWVVDSILDHRGPEGKREYFIRWSGYDDEYNTWEPQTAIKTPQILKAYWDAYKQDPDKLPLLNDQKKIRKPKNKGPINGPAANTSVDDPAERQRAYKSRWDSEMEASDLIITHKRDRTNRHT